MGGDDDLAIIKAGISESGEMEKLEPDSSRPSAYSPISARRTMRAFSTSSTRPKRN
jgi:hypothetical protein